MTHDRIDNDSDFTWPHGVRPRSLLDFYETAGPKVFAEKVSTMSNPQIETITEALRYDRFNPNISAEEIAAKVLKALGRSDEAWQNIDRIINSLEDAGCCRNGQVMASEDHVANTIRNWLRSLYGISPIKETKQTFYSILSRSIPQDMIDGIWQEIEEAGIFK